MPPPPPTTPSAGPVRPYPPSKANTPCPTAVHAAPLRLYVLRGASAPPGSACAFPSTLMQRAQASPEPQLSTQVHAVRQGSHSVRTMQFAVSSTWGHCLLMSSRSLDSGPTTPHILLGYIPITCSLHCRTRRLPSRQPVSARDPPGRSPLDVIHITGQQLHNHGRSGTPTCEGCMSWAGGMRSG